jgi:antitoxin YefM
MAQYTLPITEARARFLSMVKEAGDALAQYVITYRGKPQAVMLSFEEFEGWLESLDILQSPSWKRAVAQAAKEEKAGKRLSYEAVVGRKQKGRRR